MKIDNSLERNLSETTSQFLERLKNAGYIFHGSNNPNISILEPKATIDKTSSENTDTAVFATDNIIWATIFGVWGGHKGWKTDTYGDGSVLATISAEEKENVEKASGCIYVLSKENFGEPNPGRQFKSHLAVTPLIKIIVNLQDYFDLGGEIKWYDKK